MPASLDTDFAPLLVKARESLNVYVGLVHRTDDGEFAIPPRHLAEQVIPALEDDSLGHTLIIAPPGSAKTNTVMAACEWWLGQDPTDHIGYICDTSSRAAERSLAVRSVIEESAAFRAIFPDCLPEQKRGWAQDAWYLRRPNIGDKNPSFLAAGMDTAILGARLNKVVLDDVWSPKQVYSELERDKAKRFLDTVVMTRLHPTRGRAIGICTRWGEDDFADWAMERGWHVIVIKALDEQGQSYWGEYWPASRLRCPNDQHTPGRQCCKLIEVGGSIPFAQQYMGEVISDEGAIVKPHWWGSWDELPDLHRGAIVADTAGWENRTKHGDPAAMSVWLTDGWDYYVADVVEGYFDFNEVESILKNMRQEWGVPVVVEDVPWARPLIQRLQKAMTGVVPWKVQGRSKAQRLDAVTGIIEQGRVYLPRNSSWRQHWIEQHKAFPFGKHDDLVDNSSMALGFLDRGGARSRLGQKRVYRPMRRWEYLTA